MEKSAEAFRTISEVAELLDTPAHVLRFWESRFPQVRPVKRAGGRRYYRPTDVALLSGIKRLLHDEGLTIRGVQKVLREQGIRHVVALADGATLPDAQTGTAALIDLEGEVAEPAPDDTAEVQFDDSPEADAVPATRSAEPQAASASPSPPQQLPLWTSVLPDSASGDAAPASLDVPKPSPAPIPPPPPAARDVWLPTRLRRLDPARAAEIRPALAALRVRLAALRARLADAARTGRR